MAKIEFGCLPTAIGSMPQADAAQASALVLKYLPNIPHWPQLPQRSPKENMYIQYSEGFPGVSVEGDKIWLDRGGNFDRDLEILYMAAESNDVADYGISRECAAGLHHFLKVDLRTAWAVKGQLVGPISLGLMATDREQRAIIYDETLAEATAKFLRLKARWLEQSIRSVAKDSIIFVDEPSLSSLGSAFVSLPNEKAAALLEEVFGGISGIKGLHCCGGADWAWLLKTSIDVLSFDAYNYAQSLNLYPDEVGSFLTRGGTIAWGIVPNVEETLAKETVASLADRLEDAMAPFTRKGTVRFRQLIEQGLLTPSCGLAYLSADSCELALGLLSDLSKRLRGKYLT